MKLRCCQGGLSFCSDYVLLVFLYFCLPLIMIMRVDTCQQQQKEGSGDNDELRFLNVWHRRAGVNYTLHRSWLMRRATAVAGFSVLTFNRGWLRNISLRVVLIVATGMFHVSVGVLVF